MKFIRIDKTTILNLEQVDIIHILPDRVEFGIAGCLIKVKDESRKIRKYLAQLALDLTEE